MLDYIKRFISLFKSWFIRSFAVELTEGLYHDFWELRLSLTGGGKHKQFKERLYFAYIERYGSWIGLGATFKDIPVMPHGFNGIFISNRAKVGSNVVIMQQVTIGSNTTIGSKHNGSPTIGDNVFIGVGAKIIGNITIGHNSRIGANCVVVNDVPPNSVVVLGSIRTITKDVPLDNRWIGMAPEKKD